MVTGMSGKAALFCLHRQRLYYNTSGRLCMAAAISRPMSRHQHRFAGLRALDCSPKCRPSVTGSHAPLALRRVLEANSVVFVTETYVPGQMSRCTTILTPRPRREVACKSEAAKDGNAHGSTCLFKKVSVLRKARHASIRPVFSISTIGTPCQNPRGFHGLTQSKAGKMAANPNEPATKISPSRSPSRTPDQSRIAFSGCHTGRRELQPRQQAFHPIADARRLPAETIRLNIAAHLHQPAVVFRGLPKRPHPAIGLAATGQASSAAICWQSVLDRLFRAASSPACLLEGNLRPLKVPQRDPRGRASGSAVPRRHGVFARALVCGVSC
jgi:hypothetical protein